MEILASWLDSPLGRFLVYSAPYLVVSGVGILLAVIHWQRHSKASLLLLFACLLMMVCVLVYPVVNLIDPDWFQGLGLRTIVLLLQSVSGIASTGLFIAASLSQRSSETELTLTAGVQTSQRSPYGGGPPPIVSSPPPAQALSPSDDPKARLRNLEDLHNDGLLTDAEYQGKREEILGEV